MKKLLVCAAIASLMIFTAGLASAAPIPVCTSTACTETGTLYLVEADGTTITEVDGVVLTLTHVAKETTPDTDQPNNFWSGTLLFPAGSPLGTSATTVNISAVKAPWSADDPNVFPDMAGTNAAGTLSLMATGWSNDQGYNPTTSKNAYGFGIRGKIFDGATFVGVFKGILFP
ncbi:exported hypothetical protein [Syntrophobacter sp. SbD1]|nr:exported hypothetical protein [Syntrophobacter sp. SbD1]